MPPTFVYAMALTVYLAVGCAVWTVAAVLALPAKTRRFAGKMAAGMAGSFPGVFLFQLLVTPFVLFILLIVHVVFGTRDLTRGWEIGVVWGMALTCLGMFSAASCLGFYLGWRVAWELAAGRSARSYLHANKIMGPVFRLLRRRIRVFDRLP